MSKQTVHEAINLALNGSRKIEIILYEGSFAGVAHLLLMRKERSIRFSRIDKRILWKIWMTGRWQPFEMVITLTDKFNKLRFAGYMEAFLKNIYASS